MSDPMLDLTCGIKWPLIVDPSCYEMLVDIIERRYGFDRDVAEDQADLKRRIKSIGALESKRAPAIRFSM